ncbi:hypothetical protein [Burkholderia cepacia]|uniref:hypothetical protein n=1 Tax=Burkholderia cepacia TaxID=292 RepID=UPI0012D92128|nr:hypothetical protein [Burkholderia cepacia]
MNQRPVPKAERSIFFTRVDALRPSDPPLGVEPAADNNVMKVTEHCLFMRTAFGSIYGGRSSMSWWAAVITPFIFVLDSALEYVNYRYFRANEGYNAGFVTYYFEHWMYPVGMVLVLLLGCFWMFIPWRTQLPIIFNRRTRRVTCLIQGKWVYQSWDYLEAYIKDVTTFAVHEGGIFFFRGELGISCRSVRRVSAWLLLDLHPLANSTSYHLQPEDAPSHLHHSR